MKKLITITQGMAQKYHYTESSNCPMFHALKNEGVNVKGVGGASFDSGFCYIESKWTPTTFYGWSIDKARELAHGFPPALLFWYDDELRTILPAESTKEFVYEQVRQVERKVSESSPATLNV